MGLGALYQSSKEVNLVYLFMRRMAQKKTKKNETVDEMCSGACPSAKLWQIIGSIIHRSLTGSELSGAFSEPDMSISYTCFTCDTDFDSPSGLDVHQKDGNKKRHTDFMCKSCGLSFLNQCNMDCHFKRSGCSRPRCKFCSHLSNNKREHDLHLLNVHNIK